MAGMAVTLASAVPLVGQPTLLHLEPAEGQVSRYVTGFEVSMAGTVIETARQYHTETVAVAAAGVIETEIVIDSTTLTTTGIGDPLLLDLSGMGYTVMHVTRARPWGVTDAGTLAPEGGGVRRVHAQGQLLGVAGKLGEPGRSLDGRDEDGVADGRTDRVPGHLHVGGGRG